MKFLITENQIDRIVDFFLDKQEIVQSKKNPNMYLINGKTAFIVSNDGTKLKYAYFMENMLDNFLKGVWKEDMLLNWFNNNFGFNFESISRTTEVSPDDFGVPDPNDPDGIDWGSVQSSVERYMTHINSQR